MVWEFAVFVRFLFLSSESFEVSANVKHLNLFILLVKSTCGQTTNQLDIYFQNPGWPQASQDRLICTLTVELQEDVAQMRLDFVTFEVMKE